MDVEHLSKVQIVLLVLLCTFVASIMTGIVTVALLAQAPPAVTQTVNHIIQRTVETVAPSTGIPTTIKETTVVVKEDELLSSSISSAFNKVGIVHETTATSSPIIALGIPVGSVLLTDASVVTDEHAVEIGGVVLTYKVDKKISEVGVVVLTLVDGKVPSTSRVGDTGQIKLGQSVVVLPSASGARVGIGAVTARYTLGRVGEGEDEVVIRAIDTNIGGKIAAGAPLLNAFGDVIGISTMLSQGPAGGVGTFVSISDLSSLYLGVKGTSTPALITTP
jgi:hypothetical protein